MINSLPFSGNSFLFHIEFNKFMDLSVNCSTPCINQSILLGFDQYLVICLFGFSIGNSISQALGSGTSGSAVCISVCLTSLTLYTSNSWEKWFLHLAIILWVSVTKSPFSSLTYVSPRLGTLLKVTDAPKQVSDIFGLTVGFKFINFSFQIFLLFVPEMSASYVSYVL